MSEEFIRPSWQDAAERSLRAYDEEHAKLERIRDLCEQAQRRKQESVALTFYNDPFPALVSAQEVLEILDGHDRES